MKDFLRRLKSFIKRYVKKFLYKKLSPAVFRFYSRKPVNEKLVLFADSSSLMLPDNMTEFYDKLNEMGYETRLFLKRKGSKKWYKDKFYELVNSCRFTKYYAQCSCLILTDYYYYAYANKPRKGQQVIQLWHGCGAFKKWGYSTAKLEWGADEKSLEEYPIHNTYTYVTVSDESVKKFYAEAFNCDEKIIHADGVPRTDKYFSEKYVSSAREKVLEKYPQIGNRKIILYSPTFRGASKGKANFIQMLDFIYLKKHLEKEYVILVKLHPFIKKGMNLSKGLEEIYGNFVFDVSKTLPIDDAMCASDMVVTDYSSLIFEYALLSRPMIFFAYDLEQYDRERSFYFNYKNFVPGDIVRDTEELLKAIRKNENNFDCEKVRAFKEKFMSACDGKSTERILNKITKGKRYGFV